MWIKKKVRVTTEQLEQSDEEDEDKEAILVIRPRSTRKPPPAKLDPKGKIIATSLGKTKKSKEPQNNKIPQKKRKNFICYFVRCQEGKGMFRVSSYT